MRGLAMRESKVRRWLVCVVLVAAVAGTPAVDPVAAQAPSPTAEADWAVPNGRYYTQAGGGAGGYTIADDDGVPFWSAFQQLGGTAALGFPASRRFLMGGLTYQLTQAALLQWRPDEGRAVLGNTFELLQEAGRDEWLAGVKGIPRPIVEDGAGTFDDAVRVRLGWLTEPAIRERFLRHPNPAVGGQWTERDAINLYGLPMSRPERVGPFIAQRFQRIAFQLWVEGVPGMPQPGTVTAILGGDLLKEAGLVTGTAVTPHAAAAVVSRPVTVGATPFPTPATFAATPTPPRSAGQSATATRPTPSPTARTIAGMPVATARPSTLQVLDGTMSEYSIYLPQLTAQVGVVRFTLTNTGTLRHNLRVIGNGVDTQSADLRPGQSGHVDVTFIDVGAYYVYCDIGDHEDQGMSLTFNIVQ